MMCLRWQAIAGVGAALLTVAACSRPAPAPGPAEQVILEPGQVAEAEKVVIPILGDSLTAGLGLTTTQAFPARLQEMFLNEGYREVEIQNAGVSGDTTAGGLRRVQSLLAPNVKGMVVALG